MHPIFVTIPLSWTTAAVIALLFGLGGLVRARFKPAPGDASYLAGYLGLNVQWGQVQKPWSEAVVAGLMQAGIAAAVAVAAKLLLARVSPGTESVPLHFYGVMMASGFIIGLWLATRQVRREQFPAVQLYDQAGRILRDKNKQPVTVAPSDLIADLTFYLLVAGLAGSRVLYIITRWDAEYAHNPAKIFRVWEGGLVFYGGLIGATLTAYWFARKHRISFLPYADVLVPSVALGHALGRLGCFAAGCCFGNVAMDGFPLAVSFPEGSAAFHEHLRDGLLSAGATASLPVYPTQIIEALGETLIFFALLFIRTRKRFHGQVLLSYLFLYPILRTILEMFRGDKIRGFVFKWPSAEHPMLLSTSQAVSVLVAAAGIAVTVAIIRQKNRAQQQPAPEAVKPA